MKKSLIFLSIAFILFYFFRISIAQCTKDIDCKGNEICIEGECVTPIDEPEIRKSNTGLIYIEMHPKDADLLIDGKFFYGDKRKIRLKPGKRVLTIRKNDIEKSQATLIQAGDEVYVRLALSNMNAKRTPRWGFSIDLSWFIGKDVVTVGPKCNIGAFIEDHYLGIDFLWAVQDIDGKGDTFGGGFIYAYEFKLDDIFAVSPAITIGYWNERIRHWHSGNVDQFGWYYKNIKYYGGPLIKLRIGHKPAFFKSDITFLFGTEGVVPMINQGIKLIF